MVQVTLSDILPNTVPADGWKVEYRIKGSGVPYTTIGPYTAQPIQFQTTDPGGTLYEGNVWSDCGDLESTKYPWVTICGCPDGYAIAPDAISCQKVESIPATVTNPGYCLAPSTNGAYGNYGARAYNPGFNNATLDLPPGSSGGFIFGSSTTVGQWSNPTLSPTVGPLNREGVWIDSDCNGVKDALAGGVSTTLAFTYNNIGIARQIYVGVGADNQFRLVVNGTEICETTVGGSDIPFKIWHIIPVNLVVGLNYFNIVAVGDGSTNDAMGLVVYNHTDPAVILAATDDSQLNILFASHTLRGGTYDVATCPDGYSLDTSGGSGNFVCTRKLVAICNGAA
jgi:hypothetical protein